MNIGLTAHTPETLDSHIEYALSVLNAHKKYGYRSCRYLVSPNHGNEEGTLSAIISGIYTDAYHNPQVGDIFLAPDVDVTKRLWRPNHYGVTKYGTFKWLSFDDDDRRITYRIDLAYSQNVRIPVPGGEACNTGFGAWIVEKVNAFEYLDEDSFPVFNMGVAGDKQVSIPPPPLDIPGLTHNVPEGIRITFHRAYPERLGVY